MDVNPDSSGNDPNAPVTCNTPPARRSSIFKPYVTKRADVQETCETQPGNGDLQEYKLALQGEIQQWEHKHAELLKNRTEVKAQLQQDATTVSFDLKDLGLENQEFFDHSIYHRYIHSVEKFCDRVTCLAMMNKNRDIREKSILDLSMKKIISQLP